MNTRGKLRMTAEPATPVPTPLLEELYNEKNEAALDQETREIRAFEFAKTLGNRGIIPMERRDVTTMNEDDNERFTRMNRAWNKGHGEKVRRKRRYTKVARIIKRKRKVKYKKYKWIPRAKWLANKKK